MIRPLPRLAMPMAPTYTPSMPMHIGMCIYVCLIVHVHAACTCTCPHVHRMHVRMRTL